MFPRRRSRPRVRPADAPASRVLGARPSIFPDLSDIGDLPRRVLGARPSIFPDLSDIRDLGGQRRRTSGARASIFRILPGISLVGISLAPGVRSPSLIAVSFASSAQTERCGPLGTYRRSDTFSHVIVLQVEPVENARDDGEMRGAACIPHPVERSAAHHTIDDIAFGQLFDKYELLMSR
jgi:hypothetical protein